MSQVTDFAAVVNTAFVKVNTDMDSIKTSIADLNAQIVAFQNSPGTLSAADQAALDGIQAASQLLVAKADAMVVVSPVPPPAVA